MNYDISVHIGQQVENLLNGYAAGDAGAMERAKNNLLDIFKNEGKQSIVEAIEKWDKDKQTEIGKIWQKANESIRTMAVSKKDEGMFIDIKEIEGDVIRGLNELEAEYWDSIRNLFLKNLNDSFIEPVEE